MLERRDLGEMPPGEGDDGGIRSLGEIGPGEKTHPSGKIEENESWQLGMRLGQIEHDVDELTGISLLAIMCAIFSAGIVVLNICLGWTS